MDNIQNRYQIISEFVNYLTGYMKAETTWRRDIHRKCLFIPNNPKILEDLSYTLTQNYFENE